MKPSLIVGADGMIGAALLAAHTSFNVPAIATTRRQGTLGPDRFFLDLAGGPEIDDFDEEIGTAFLCAGTGARECRKNPAGTALVNLVNQVELARALAEAGTHVVFLSTDRVFDGSRPYRGAAEPVSPVSEYGRQKAQAEAEILKLRGAAVVRLTQILAPGDAFLVGWLKELAGAKPIRPFHDRHIAPVPLPLVLEVLMRIAAAKLPGLFQVSAACDLSMDQIAVCLAMRLGAPIGLVKPISHRDSGVAMDPPPRFTTLDTTRAQKELGLPVIDPFTAILQAVTPPHQEPAQAAA